jgi:pimeloyl-ACP methyl ester carboxylesterase
LGRACLLAAVALTAGCSVLRPTPTPMPVALSSGGAQDASVDAWFEGEGGACLLVMLPGIGNSANAFVESGFLEDEGEGPCDLAIVDAHFAYYLTESLVERLTTDVLEEAEARGYASVWLVGVSLGGYGALLAAEAHPELVDGLVLIAPMLGVPPREPIVVEEIAAAGGLHRWPGPDPRARPRHLFAATRRVWGWLREATQSPSWDGRLVLAWGDADRRADRYAMVAEVLPPHAVHRAPGAHDWSTWRRLWRLVLADPPWVE